MLHRDGNNIIANDLPLIKGKKQVIQQNWFTVEWMGCVWLLAENM
jgi:hypothetical protein